MKKGFTLIEMIAVIAIMGLITALILPNLVNQVNSKKDNISSASKNLIYSATELYMGDNSSNYKQINNNVYCIKLEDLVKGGYLEKPLKDMKTNKDIPLDNKVKVSFNEYNEPIYELNSKSECNQKIAPNYGTKIETLYTNLYTNNTPILPYTSTDTSDAIFDGNYHYPKSLSYNLIGGSTDIGATPVATINNSNGIVYSGSNSYNLERETNLNRWIYFQLYCGGLTTNVQITNFKLNFSNSSSLTLEEAVNSKYIEPLVIISSSSSSGNYIWKNTYNLISGGSTTTGNYPSLILMFKVKDKASLTGYTISTNKAWNTTYDGVRVAELVEGTEISIDPMA